MATLHNIQAESAVNQCLDFMVTGNKGTQQALALSRARCDSYIKSSHYIASSTNIIIHNVLRRANTQHTDRHSAADPQNAVPLSAAQSEYFASRASNDYLSNYPSIRQTQKQGFHEYYHTWTGDRQKMDKPSRYITGHPGQLSLAILHG